MAKAKSFSADQTVWAPIALAEQVSALTKHARMFEDMKGLTDPLDKLTWSFREIDRVGGLADAVRGQNMLTQMCAMNDDLIRRADLGLGRFAMLDRSADLARATKSCRALFETMDRIGDAHRIQKTLFDSTSLAPFEKLHDQMIGMGAAAEFTRGYDTMARLYADIETRLGLDRAAPWASHLAGITAPSMSLLAIATVDRPVGVLSALDDVRSSLTWLRTRQESDSSALAAAVLVNDNEANVPRAHRIAIRINVRCEICDEQMLSSGEAFEWLSDDEGVFELGVFPLCAACTRRARDDIGYWSEHLASRLTPKLEILHGGDQGDHEPAARGLLRLVKVPEDDLEP